MLSIKIYIEEHSKKLSHRHLGKNGRHRHECEAGTSSRVKTESKYGSRICLTLVFLFCVLLKNKLNAKISKGDTMLYDFIIIDKTSCAPLYMQIYASIRRSVENGSLVKNTKLPSVRQLSSGLEVSKTTVSAAYEQLCVEGYIKNKPQSGYYVEAQFENAPKKSENTHSSAIARGL